MFESMHTWNGRRLASHAVASSQDLPSLQSVAVVKPVANRNNYANVLTLRNRRVKISLCENFATAAAAAAPTGSRGHQSSTDQDACY